MSETWKLAAVALIFLLGIAYGLASIVWAVECGNKGGAYIVPQNSFPVCVQGVK